MRDIKKIGICITIPKTVKWEDYEKELAAVADWSQEMNYKVTHLPTKVKKGDRCYLCYDGNIIGWMTITNVGEKDFQCTTTGKDWGKGYYISRSGPFNEITPIPCKGFRGFKYVSYIVKSGEEDTFLNEQFTNHYLYEFSKSPLAFLNETRSVVDCVQGVVKNFSDTMTKQVNDAVSDGASNVIYTEKNSPEILKDIKDCFFSHFTIDISLWAKEKGDYEGFLSTDKSFSFENGQWVCHPYIRIFVVGENVSDLILKTEFCLGHELTHAYNFYQYLIKNDGKKLVDNSWSRNYDKTAANRRVQNKVVSCVAEILYTLDRTERNAYIAQLRQELKGRKDIEDIRDMKAVLRDTESYDIGAGKPTNSFVG